MQFNYLKIKPWLLGVTWLYRLPKEARGEEQSILNGATVSDNQVFTDSITNKFMLIDENFTNHIVTENLGAHDAMKEFSIFLAKQENILTVFIHNKHDIRQLPKSEIRIGTDRNDFSMIQTKHSGDIYDGGFQKLSANYGDKLTIRRTESDSSPSYDLRHFHVSEMRAYLSPNLLEILDVAIITNSGATTSVGHNNLITNWGNRGFKNGYKPLIGMNDQRGDFESCMTELCDGCGSTKFVFAIDHKESVFVHAFLFVLQITDYPRLEPEPLSASLVGGFHLYVGDSTDYKNNQLCTFVNASQHRGAETFCNLQGRYVHMVNQSLLRPKWEVVICSVGTFGTIYERDNPPPTTKTIKRGVLSTFQIENIKQRSGLEMTNVQDIKVRQKAGSELSWVSLTPGISDVTVSVDTLCQTVVGVHSLILESYDQNSPLASPTVLKTDSIAITVEEATNQIAHEKCGELTAAFQTETLNDFEYEVHSGAKSTSLPVIDHLDGYTISQEIASGLLELADGTATNVSLGDTSFLASFGVSIQVVGEQASLKVEISDKLYYGATLQLQIKSTLAEEPTWFNTSNVKVVFTRPPCAVTKEILLAQEAIAVLNLQAEQLSIATLDFSDLQIKANEAFQVIQNPYCGPLQFQFTDDPSLPFSFDQSTQKFSLAPSLDDLEGQFISKQAKFNFEDFPDRTWNAPIQLEIQKCSYQNNKKAVACGVIPQAGLKEKLPNIIHEIGQGLQQISLPVVQQHLAGYTTAQLMESGSLEFYDGTVVEIKSYDIGKLTQMGIVIETLSDVAFLNIDVEDKVYAGSKLQLKIKSTLTEEPDWFNTTELSIRFKSESFVTDSQTETNSQEIISALETEKEKVKEFVQKIYKEPVLIPEPTSMYQFEVNQQISINIGTASNPSIPGDETSIEVDFGGAENFLALEQTPTISFVQTRSTNVQDEGSYGIKITLSSFVDGISLTKAYKTTLMIVNSTKKDADDQTDSDLVQEQEAVNKIVSQPDIIEESELSTVEIQTNNDILEKDVKDIEDSDIFSSVPLITALTQKGIGPVKDLISRQKELIIEQVANSDSNNLVEARVKNFDNSGTLKIYFTQEIGLAANVDEQVGSVKAQRRRNMRDRRSGKTGLVEATGVRENDENSSNDEGQDSNASKLNVVQDWEIISIDKEGIDIKFNFESPLNVSQEEKADLVLVQIALGQLNTDPKLNLPESVIKLVQIPRQMASEEQAEQVKSQGESGTFLSYIVIALQIALGAILSVSMGQIWAIIESLQVVSHAPLFDMKSPGNVNAFNKYFVEMASFNFFDVTTINESYMYLPESDPFSPNFMMSGYDTVLIVPGIGLLYYSILGFLSLIVLYYLLKPLFKACKNRLDKLSNAMRKFLFWNSMIRFITEAYCELSLMSIINVHSIQWYEGLTALDYNNCFAILIAVLVVIFPIALLIHYFRLRKNWSDERFRQSTGSLMEKTNMNWEEGHWMILFLPAVYFIRRMALTLTAVYWSQFFWGQICCQFVISLALLIFLQWSRPLKSKFENNIETFNECMTLLALYALMCFTDFVSSPVDRDMIGSYYIAAILIFIGIHMFFMLAGIVHSLRLLAKRQVNKCAARNKKSSNVKSLKKSKSVTKVNENEKHTQQLIQLNPNVEHKFESSSNSEISDKYDLDEPKLSQPDMSHRNILLSNLPPQNSNFQSKETNLISHRLRESVKLSMNQSKDDRLLSHGPKTQPDAQKKDISEVKLGANLKFLEVMAELDDLDILSDRSRSQQQEN